MVAISADGRIRNGNVEFHLKKERKIVRIKNILSALSIEYKIYKHKDGTVSINFKDKNYRKDLNWVYGINHGQALLVSQECLLWDGHKGYRSFFSTTHKDYADAIQFAFAACGIRAGIHVAKYKKDSWKPSYIVIPTRNEFVGINKKSYEEKTIDGYKYCFNVETSYFVARRGNNIFITGNCGMYVVPLGKVEIELEKFDKVVNEKIPSGFNIHDTPQRIFMDLNMLHCRDVIDFDMAQRSIGSLGGGNHFIELNEDEEGNKYLVIHSGSRNLGVRVCQYYQKIAEKNCRKRNKDKSNIIAELKAQGRESEIQDAIKKARAQDIPFDKDLAHLTGEDMKDYLHDMDICQRYAELNRETIADLILTEFDYATCYATETPFHTIHNYIEMSFARQPMLRKGAVAAYKNQKLIIPMNMRDGSLLCIGKGNLDWNCSAPHGAGRIMSRKKAKEAISMAEFEKSMSDVYSTSVCESTIDEAPQAYKPMQSIIDAIHDTVDIVKIIKPIYNFKAKKLTMTQKFTTPCFIRKNTAELRKKLEELGYIYDKCNLLDLALYPCLYTYWHPNLEGLYSGIGAYPNNTINCRTDDELFLAIAALREDTDKGQWFCDDNGLWEKTDSDLPSRYMQMHGHKATVEEIIEHFKD